MSETNDFNKDENFFKDLKKNTANQRQDVLDPLTSSGTDKYLDHFIDTRTGEPITCTEERIPENGRGRGGTIINLLKTEFRLKKQLRLARPMGSGDGAIESHCKRIQAEKNPSGSNLISTTNVKNKSQLEDSFPVSEPSPNVKTKIENKLPIERCLISKFKNNVLMMNLLSKSSD